jgi:hypothetical protein
MMTSEQLMLNSAIASWKQVEKRASKMFSSFTEQQFLQEIAPGRNRAIYLLGHLTAVHDLMLPLLGLGERLHPELDVAFITNPDKSVAELPSVADLMKDWTEVNSALIEKFEALSPAEWLQRHTAMTDEDFAKDPGRNRFSVLLSRTNHLSFHVDQLILVRK